GAAAADLAGARQAQDADDRQRDLAREQETVRRRDQARLRAIRADHRQGFPQPLHQGTQLGAVMASIYATTEASTQLAAQISAHEQRLYRAQIAGAVEDIEPMLSADLRYLHSTGVAESRSEYLKGVVDRLYEYGEIASRKVRLHVSE